MAGKAVSLGVIVALAVGVSVAVPVGGGPVAVAVADDDGFAVGEFVGLCAAVDVALGDAVERRVDDGVAVTVGVDS